MWTILELIKWATADFEARGIDSARLDAEMLLAHALGARRVDLYMRFDQVPEKQVLDAFRELVKKRRAREPVAHIIGKKGFHEIEVLTPAGRFVPRPETEIMVDEALAGLKALAVKNPRMLDLCTGTGAVALAVLHSMPGVRAVVVDVDGKAGEVVEKNAELLGQKGRIEFRCGDLFGPAGSESFSLITCNPPYIPTGDIDSLMPEVGVHEPRLALDGGADGLDVVRRVIADAPDRLDPGGRLIIEVGEGQAKQVEAMAKGSLVHETTRRDLQGIPRIVIFKKTG